MKKSLILLFTLTTIFSCGNSQKSIYDVYNECFDESVMVEGKPISYFIKEYEEILISEGTLEDNTSKSYFELYEKFSKDETIPVLKSDYSLEEKIINTKVVNIQFCLPKVYLHGMSEFKESSFSKIIDVMLDENGDPRQDLQNINPDEYFEPETFNYNYFRLTLLKLVDRKIGNK